MSESQTSRYLTFVMVNVCYDQLAISTMGYNNKNEDVKKPSTMVEHGMIIRSATVNMHKRGSEARVPN